MTRLEQIKARLEKATPVDWTYSEWPHDLAALLKLAEAAERWEEAWHVVDPQRVGEYEGRRTELLKAVRAFRDGGREG